MATGFGIVGCGMIANFHALAVGDIRGAKITACFDAFPAAAQRFAAANPGVTAYDSLDDMLADPSVDIVTICTPSGAHRDPAVAAANAGKHVVVEKPLEITLKRCDAIIDACRKNRVKLTTIFPSRYHGVTQALKSAIDSGRFGKLTLGDSYVKWWRTQEYYDSGGWRGTWDLDGGGAYMNQAIHSVDLIAYLMGNVSQVTALTDTLAHKRIEVEDVGVAAVMPLGSPIGSNRGLKAKAFLSIIIEQSTLPVVVDAGIGSPSHAAEAMELGADAVLVNTALAVAKDPAGMGEAFRKAVEAGRTARLSGLGAALGRAEPSSPLTSFLQEK